MKFQIVCMTMLAIGPALFANAQLAPTNTPNRTTIKLDSVQFGVKKTGAPVVFFDYSISLTTTFPRIKKPYATGYYLIQNKDTTRSGYFFPMSAERGFQEKHSRNMQEVDARTIRRISDTYVCYGKTVPKDAKIIIWRFEVWHDGALVAEQESLTAEQRAKIGLKEDWYK